MLEEKKQAKTHSNEMILYPDFSLARCKTFEKLRQRTIFYLKVEKYSSAVYLSLLGINSRDKKRETDEKKNC